MNIDIEKFRQLLSSFSTLSPENQDIILAKVLDLEVEQHIKQNPKHGKEHSNKHANSPLDKFYNFLMPFMENWEKMSPNRRAALAMLINEETHGEFTKEEYIDLIIQSRQISISEFIEKYIPGADLEEAKKIYRSLKT